MSDVKQPSFEELKPMIRPTGVKSGVMKVDPDKCTHCGLCLRNCPFRCWEKDENDVPRMKGGEYICFSCSNCMVACPGEAISIVEPYHVTEGFFDTGYPPYKLPLDPKDKDGNPAVWNDVEKTVMHRRSVRNFKKDPVPEHLIRRVLEAGRFAPSAGNHQPWKFAVVTDPDFIAQMEQRCFYVFSALRPAVLSNQAVMNIVGTVSEGFFDPRVQNGLRLIAKKENPIFLGAPCVIVLGGCERHTDPAMMTGITGQNMNLVATSLGLGCCWSSFGGAGINFIPDLKSSLGFEGPWKVETTLCVGYPAFPQEGIVSRFSRPVRWFRPGLPPQTEE
jgi:nitroreductase/NAD-dependent dihydropyrimidine dehydrogenase PreA subunit